MDEREVHKLMGDFGMDAPPVTRRVTPRRGK